MRRWKVTGAVATACCLGLAFCLIAPVFQNDVSNPVLVNPDVNSRDMSTEFTSPGSLGYPSSGGMAVDMPKPKPGREAEKRQMNEIIESLNNRQQLLDANMLGL